ncbi:MAG: hypothetical protein JJ845_001665 [Prochlorococcus marinus CUG1436]|nr:hypothetical protein [Prochlorococcus marinus CUG1436]
MKFAKIKQLLLSTLFLTLPFHSTAIFASELFNKKSNSILIAEATNYREHNDESEDIDDPHSIDHNWSNHYHTIRSIRVKPNGNLKIKFCEKVELLEGKVIAENVIYDVKDAYKVRKKSIAWRLNKKGTFKKGDIIFVNTIDFLGRPVEKDPNPNEIRSLERGCGLPFLYLPPGVEVSSGSSPIAILGLVIAVGAAAGGGSSGGTGGSSHN